MSGKCGANMRLAALPVRALRRIDEPDSLQACRRHQLPESAVPWHDHAMVLFRARSKDRDRSSDQNRLATLVRHIGEVRSGVVRERRGLERRYADTVAVAAQLVDTDYDGERESEDEAQLVRAEADVLYARQRMAELDRQLDLLDGLAERVKIMFEPPEELKKRRQS